MNCSRTKQVIGQTIAIWCKRSSIVVFCPLGPVGWSTCCSCNASAACFVARLFSVIVSRRRKKTASNQTFSERNTSIDEFGRELGFEWDVNRLAVGWAEHVLRVRVIAFEPSLAVPSLATTSSSPNSGSWLKLQSFSRNWLSMISFTMSSQSTRVASTLLFKLSACSIRPARNNLCCDGCSVAYCCFECRFRCALAGNVFWCNCFKRSSLSNSPLSLWKEWAHCVSKNDDCNE